MKYLSIVLALALTLTGCNSKQKEREAQRELDQITAREQAETDALRADTARIEHQIVELEFGSSAAALFDKCNAAPPTKPEHQRQCQALRAKLEKSKHEDAVRIAREKADW